MSVDVVDIDPAGDIVLVCGQGDNQKLLRVASNVLSFGSPVFKTMLGPSFKEGKQLSVQGTLDLPLPDDDGGDMTIICDILHLRHSKLSRRLDVEKLEDVSILADKYNCTVALGPIAEHWVRELRSACSDATRVSLICSAFRLRLPLMFKELGRDHILRHGAPWQLEGDRPEHKMLQKVFDAAPNEAFIVRTKLGHFFDERIAAYCDTGRKAPNNCFRGVKYGPDFVRTLKEAGLWPFHRATGLTIEAIMEKMRSIGWNQSLLGVANCNNRNMMGGAMGGATSGACFCTLDLWNDNRTLASLFEAEADRITNEIPDLCLECVLQGQYWKKTDCNHSQDPSLPFGL